MNKKQIFSIVAVSLLLYFFIVGAYILIDKNRNDMNRLETRIHVLEQILKERKTPVYRDSYKKLEKSKGGDKI